MTELLNNLCYKRAFIFHDTTQTSQTAINKSRNLQMITKMLVASCCWLGEQEIINIQLFHSANVLQTGNELSIKK